MASLTPTPLVLENNWKAFGSGGTGAGAYSFDTPAFYLFSGCNRFDLTGLLTKRDASNNILTPVQGERIAVIPVSSTGRNQSLHPVITNLGFPNVPQIQLKPNSSGTWDLQYISGSGEYIGLEGVYKYF